MNRKIELLRSLRLHDAVAIVVGSIIGAGIFRTPSSIARILPFPGLIILAWVVGGLICFSGALCFGELSASFPKSGGEYVYLREAFGKSFSFVYGWTKALVIRAGAISAIAYVFAGYLGYFVPLSAPMRKSVASLAILLLSLVNLLGVGYGKGMQNLLTLLKVLALGAIILFGALIGKAEVANLGPLLPAEFTGGLIGAFGMSLIFVLWTYGGWNESAYVGGEVRIPGRNLPRSILIGLAIVFILYLVTNILWLLYVPLEKIGTTEVVASVMMEGLLGKVGGVIVSLVILVSTLGALNALILTGGRISYSIARDNLILRKLATIHQTFKTPALAITVNALWATVLVFSGTFEQLVSFSSIGFWFFLSMTGMSLFVLRKRFPSISRPYEVWGYPVVPLVFIASSLFLVINTAILRPIESLMGILIMLSALPVYFFSRRKPDVHPRGVH